MKKRRSSGNQMIQHLSAKQKEFYNKIHSTECQENKSEIQKERNNVMTALHNELSQNRESEQKER